MTERQIIAKFHPQAWIKDYTVEVDPERPTEFGVTEEILRLSKEEALSLKDDDYRADDLRYVMSAPTWVVQWPGPFWVEVEEAIRQYFEREQCQRN